MRFLAFAVPALVLLASCGQTPSTNKQAAAEPGQVTLSRTRDMPDWLLVARTSDRGFVHFNQRTIVRNPDGTADIWVQIRHGSPQLEGEQGAETIRYQLERVQYRFRCSDDQFKVVKRQFLDDENTVAAEQDYSDSLWRGVPRTGPARIVQPIACRGR
jgi:hypothetical protein